MLFLQWYITISTGIRTKNLFPFLQIQFTPLMEACKTGDVKMAQLLLDNNADPNIGNDVSVL